MASSSSSSVEGKMIKLRSSDGEEFEVEEAVALQSQMIRYMIEDDCADNVIPVHNVEGDILVKVFEYCKKHVPSSSANDDLKSWDAEFMKFDEPVLFEIMLAANYLDIKNLLDLACQTVADMIKHKSPEEIRKIFNIQNDFTPEEEEEVRKENQWAYE